jgi:maltooligosyltrehalose trehalohydrolase
MPSAPARLQARRLPVGAETGPAGVHFRVWAPDRKRVQVVLEDAPHASSSGKDAAAGRTHDLTREADGYFSDWVSDAGQDTLYRYILDGDGPYPDPASRFQPVGPHGPSQVIDPSTFGWTDAAWKGVTLQGQVIYELHVGTFTPGGTWADAARELPELAACGITLIEVMPIAEFPGRFGWGYDGVNLFAPTRLYGVPDDCRRFIDQAHALGIGVILDVVYNHFGPDGNYLDKFAAEYFSTTYRNEWGKPINFDSGQRAARVREFYLANVRYWIEEFHIDGLRLDATQQIFDASPENIMRAITRCTRDSARGRGTIVVGENESQDVRLLHPAESGGYELDALWNDDYHHSTNVAATGHAEAYYTDYLGSPQELVSAVKWGFLYQGQLYAWQRNRRGTPTHGIPRAAFIDFLQNHDQIANSARGARLHQLTSPGRYRALTALLLLGPGTPMLFQGQEFAASAPFLYFADHVPELAAKVKEGRAKFLKQFRSLAGAEMQALLTDPASARAFEASKLDLSERHSHATTYALHRELLALRRNDPVFASAEAVVDGAVLTAHAFVLRWFDSQGEDDRLLIVNLGRETHFTPAPEPLLAPPSEQHWELLWSSESPVYDGFGTPPLETREGWRIPGECAIALRAVPGAAPHDANDHPAVPHG